MRTPAAVGVLAATVAVLVISGCGREFEAEEVIAELNERGTDLTLGEALPDTEPGVELTVVAFADDAQPLDGHSHGTGAVAILDDEEAAEAEFARCESAISFVCFRAGNAVLRFSSISPPEQQQLTSALEALRDEGP